jgi:hypothetical protein
MKGILVLTPSADAFYVGGRRVRPCSLALADGTVWGSSSKRPYRAPFGVLLVALGFLAKYPPKILEKISATGMVEAALAPLHIEGGSPCEYPHTDMTCTWKY